MSPQFTDDDVGKTVVNANGDDVGMVSTVEHDTAYVEPDPGITDTIRATLGWESSGDDAYPLQEHAVERVTDDAIHLKADLSGANETGTGTATDRAATGTTGTGTDIGDDSGLTDDNDNLLGDDNDSGITDDGGITDDDDKLIGDDDSGLTDDNDDSRFTDDDDDEIV